MAETAAILSPEKTVLLPDLGAGCSLAASIDGEQLREWKAAASRRGRRLVREHDRRGEGRERLLLHVGEREVGDRRDPGGAGDPLPPGHVPRPLAREGHRAEADDLAGRVPRPRRDPARRHRALAGRGARRRAARPPRVRLREPGDGVRERADADPLDGEDDRLREALAEAAVPHRDRDGDHPPAPARGARQEVRAGARRRRVPLHEGDDAREGARLAPRQQAPRSRWIRSSPSAPACAIERMVAIS